MAGPTAADWAALKTGAQQCHSSAEAIDAAVRQMLAQLDGIRWRGAARTAFENAKAQVQADCRTIVERLQAIGNGIDNASASMMATDEDSRASLDSVAGGTAAPTGSIYDGLRG